MRGRTWFEFSQHGHIEVTLFNLDGVRARAGGRGTRFFRERLAAGDPNLHGLVRAALGRMPEARHHWPEWPRPYGLTGEEHEIILPAFLLAFGHDVDEIEALVRRYGGGGSAGTVTTPRVEIVDPERSVTPRFGITMPEEREAHRREAQLVQAYLTHLSEQNIDVKRLALPVETTKLWNDIFVPERNQLIEAKGDAKRERVRLAVGQILDYLFQLENDERFHEPPAPAVLLPQRPSTSIEHFLDHLEIAAVWRIDDGFFDNRGGAFS